MLFPAPPSFSFATPKNRGQPQRSSARNTQLVSAAVRQARNSSLAQTFTHRAARAKHIHGCRMKTLLLSGLGARVAVSRAARNGEREAHFGGPNNYCATISVIIRPEDPFWVMRVAARRETWTQTV
jgi:hypothetical protein